MAWSNRCKNCGNADIEYTFKNGFTRCNHCDSTRVYEVEVKGNPAQRQAIYAGFDQKLPGLWLHFMGKRMILHNYRKSCGWSVFIGEGNKGWLEVFAVETLGDCVIGKQRKKTNKK